MKRICYDTHNIRSIQLICNGLYREWGRNDYQKNFKLETVWKKEKGRLTRYWKEGIVSKLRVREIEEDLWMDRDRWRLSVR